MAAEKGLFHGCSLKSTPKWLLPGHTSYVLAMTETVSGAGAKNRYKKTMWPLWR
jgi:hypothetical protein